MQEVAEKPVPSHQLACQGKNSTIGRLSPSFDNFLTRYGKASDFHSAQCASPTMPPHQQQQEKRTKFWGLSEHYVD